MVPGVPAPCKNVSLQRAYEALQYTQAKGGPVRVADYEVQLFETEKICLIKEVCNIAEPKISLTNSIETAIVLVCMEYGLCPSAWTFVEYANAGEGKRSYHEYDMIVLVNGNIEWRYIWHSDLKEENKPYSDGLMISRVMQYRNGARTVL